MDPLQALAARLVGTWQAVLVSDEKESSYFRMLEDLRFVAVFPMVPPNPRHPYVDMRLWGSLESESLLRLAPKQTSEGWTRDLFFEGDILVLGYTEKQDDAQTEPRKKAWHCHRVTDEETPEWFEPEFQKAMARPWL